MTKVLRLGEAERVRVLDALWWVPVRRTLGVTAFGINAYVADAAGDELVERHDETGSGAGGHEELYVVVSGRAAFTVAGEEIDAPAGTLVFVPERTAIRSAVAREAGTTVLVVGGKTGAAGPVSPWESWFAAEPAYRARDYDRAYEIASAGLRDWPDHPVLHYQLACYRSLAGDVDTALDHLGRALAGDPRAHEWASTDTDLDPLRSDPRFPTLP